MKRCFVVGYGAGVGHGVASSFAGAGYELALFCRTPDKWKELSGPLSARTFAVDAGDSAQLRLRLNEAMDEVGPPEVLIYNAVAFRQKPPTQLEAEELLGDFAVNVVGACVASRTVLPRMKSGSLLFTGGGWALYPDPAVASTAIGKAGLRHFALMLADELKGGPVRAGTITIMGQVTTGGVFDPDKIGRAFLAMHQQSEGEFISELRFTGL